jgi:hypothetical protein
MSDEKIRRRWINLGELIAIAALAVSAAGVWIAWKSSSADKPTRVVEQRQAIPLTLRGKVEDDGRRIEISPVESSHALESMTLWIRGASPIQLGSDGVLAASDLEATLQGTKDDKGSHSISARIDARYVEMGKDRRGGGSYTIRYRWEGGGLFGGRSLRFTGFGR